ncbi:lasso peptide biosynthesis B2 protein [Ningiella sp. W23]|uniref:lasso peptide biosynthesis B2 protein n=1 Tax=Ningiella sp. W23 TaxID=3023715 RepID=UPI003757E3CC
MLKQLKILLRGFTRYNPLMLLEAMRDLHRWDRVLSEESYESYKHALKNPSEDTKQSKHTLATIRELHRHLDAVVRHHNKDMNCMRRCLALKSMIERRGEQCKLHIGVKMDASKPSPLAAHSWITYKGVLINDSADEIAQYKEITNEEFRMAW